MEEREELNDFFVGSTSKRKLVRRSHRSKQKRRQ
jgi:hypothetical protein